MYSIIFNPSLILVIVIWPWKLSVAQPESPPEAFDLRGLPNVFLAPVRNQGNQPLIKQ
jgi:hypothetical protein